MSHIRHSKIIKVGNSSYGIILPIDWIRFHQLSEHDSVELISDEVVKVTPLKIKKKPEVLIDKS